MPMIGIDTALITFAGYTFTKPTTKSWREFTQNVQLYDAEENVWTFLTELPEVTSCGYAYAIKTGNPISVSHFDRMLTFILI